MIREMGTGTVFYIQLDLFNFIDFQWDKKPVPLFRGDGI